MNNARILLVDDMPLVNEGLRLLLTQEDNIASVTQAASGAECLRYLYRNPVDLVVLDHQMPGQSGLDVLREIRTKGYSTKVILVTFLLEEPLLREYLELQVNGCFHKQDSPQEFLYGVQQVLNDEQFLSATASRVLAKELSETPPPPLPPNADLDSLTRAEREVLSLIGKGFTLDEICRERNTTANTVGRQKQNIMDKLDIHKEIKLMRFAIDHGLA